MAPAGSPGVAGPGLPRAGGLAPLRAGGPAPARPVAASRPSFREELQAQLQGVGDIDPGRLPRGEPGLRWAARELEAELWSWLLKDALQGGGGSGLFGGGFAGSVYGDWLARSVAELLVQTVPSALSEQLVEQLRPHLASGSRSERNGPTRRE